jgi:hypothetical protein
MPAVMGDDDSRLFHETAIPDGVKLSEKHVTMSVIRLTITGREMGVLCGHRGFRSGCAKVRNLRAAAVWRFTLRQLFTWKAVRRGERSEEWLANPCGTPSEALIFGPGAGKPLSSLHAGQHTSPLAIRLLASPNTASVVASALASLPLS